MKKILGIFGNVANAGQERANCDVYKLLAKQPDKELLVLVNDRGFDWNLRPFFERNSIRFKKIRFPWGIYRDSNLRYIFQWAYDIIANNVMFIYNYLKFSPDYIHIGNEYMFKTLALPLSLCRAKIIFRLGDRPYINGFYNRWLWKIISSRVDTFVCDTNFIKGLLKKAGRDNKNDIVLYHPAPGRAKDEGESIQRGDSLIFGYVGQIRASKGVDIIVKAALEICETHNDVEFWFAGNISDNIFYTSCIATMLNQTPEDIRKRICFKGTIENIDSFYRAVDVHLAPSVAVEAYGLVIVEAKKNHRPTIIFRSGGMPELISHKVDGYICTSKDTEGLLQGMRYYIENPTEIKAQGESAYKSLERLGINNENFAKQWLAIYQ